MPVCKKCGVGPKATAYFRRGRKGGYLCRDKYLCDRRIIDAKKALTGGK